MDPVAILPKWLRCASREYLRKRGFIPVFDSQKVDTVWVDVGANLGQTTLQAALQNPRLLVFAFEPNWTLARQIMSRAANFVVLPMAVSDCDGFADFFINKSNGSSSLAKMEELGLAHWKDFELSVQATIAIQTIRLDTFMKVADLKRIDYLKVDAEGYDLRVVQSAGERLKDIRKIKLEVDTAPAPLYKGAPNHDEVVRYMADCGFDLAHTEAQNDGRQENLIFTRP
jgi:FkbM family methyltransferase